MRHGEKIILFYSEHTLSVDTSGRFNVNVFLKLWLYNGVSDLLERMESGPPSVGLDTATTKFFIHSGIEHQFPCDPTDSVISIQREQLSSQSELTDLPT